MDSSYFIAEQQEVTENKNSDEYYKENSEKTSTEILASSRPDNSGEDLSVKSYEGKPSKQAHKRKNAFILTE